MSKHTTLAIDIATLRDLQARLVSFGERTPYIDRIIALLDPLSNLTHEQLRDIAFDCTTLAAEDAKFADSLDVPGSFHASAKAWPIVAHLFNTLASE